MVESRRKIFIGRGYFSMIFRRVRRTLLSALMLLPQSFVLAQHANDTLCFTINLSLDENSLFCCGNNDDMKMVLSGPVLMEGKTLLFYSSNGYALYSQKGKILDSCSVFRENRRLSKDDPARLRLAYPLDQSTILYFRKTPDSKDGFEILQKKLYKKGYSKVDPVQAATFKDIEASQLFNLTNNCITDDMATRLFLQPNLVGYMSLSGGERWWSLDRFYSFTSPLIVEKNGVYMSVFTGLQHDQKTDVQKHLINPLGTYTMDNRWYYYGVHTMLGGQDPENYQRLYLCDQAGNLLYSNELLKQIIVDAVLEYDKKNNTNYTVKRPGEFVFTPAVDNNGDIFYGVIDFHKRTIKVKKRLFYRYMPRIIQPEQDIVNSQRRFTFDPVVLECPEEKMKKIVPEIMYRDEKGKRRKATLREITVKGYCANIAREPNKDLKRKFSQISSSLPAPVKHMRDSLLRLSTATCPYSLSLEHDKKGVVASFYYGCGDEVLSARVLNVTETFEVFVRVDFLDWAEVVVFASDGSFLNRFRFNRQSFLDRKDIVAVTNDRRVIEEDYERISEDYTYYSWELGISPPMQP
jgi:hypothetical protein